MSNASEQTLGTTYSEEETARRRDEALRRALNTPPQPNPSQNPKKVKEPQQGERKQA